MADESTSRDRKSPLKRKLTDTGAGLLVVVVASAMALIVLFMPRRVAPNETPGLHLSPDDVSAVLAAEAELAGEVPESELVEALEELVGDHGEAEGGEQLQGSGRARAQEINLAQIRLRTTEGEEVVRAVRARAVGRLPEMRASPASSEERQRALGDFEDTLERYGLRADGRDLAPAFVVRVLFKARWNAVVGLPMTDGMEDIELRAYWGWLALESTANPTRRIEALAYYSEAGGAVSSETRATLAYMSGAPLRSAEEFDEAHQETGSIRLRNHALAALDTSF